MGSTKMKKKNLPSFPEALVSHLPPKANLLQSKGKHAQFPGPRLRLNAGPNLIYQEAPQIQVSAMM